MPDARCVAGVAAGFDHGDVHSATPHVFSRKLREPQADAAPLIVRIDADDVDDAHPLMECVQCDGHETDRASVGNRHEDVTFIIRTARSDGFRLVRLPVRMQAEKDVVTQDIPHRREHGCPRTERELNDGVKVALTELADLNCTFCHGDRTVAACG